MSSNKREPTKYNIFVKEQMPLIKEEFPELSRQDLMRKVGELWKMKKESEKEEEEEEEEEQEQEQEEKE